LYALLHIQVSAMVITETLLLNTRDSLDSGNVGRFGSISLPAELGPCVAQF